MYQKPRQNDAPPTSLRMKLGILAFGAVYVPVMGLLVAAARVGHIISWPIRRLRHLPEHEPTASSAL